ncbi:MAG: hypothetical protein AB3N14_12280 [Flavobacteriaceae bacterium]
MRNSEKVGVALYENLGKLFFAIAMADKSVHTKEVDKLKSFVRKYWLEVDELEDEYGTDAAFRIEAVFDWLLENEMESAAGFEEFRSFYKEHKSRFTPFLKVLILDTAHAIANAYARKNKSELILLANLEILLRT